MSNETNANKLREYKRVYGLNSEQVAKLLGVSLKTVHSWLIKPGSISNRPCPEREIRFLHCLLRTRKKKNP